MHLKRNAFHTENSSGLSVVTVIGIDPGSRLMGWGIVSDRSGVLRLEGCGVIRGAQGPDKSFSARLARIYADLNDVIRQYKPAEAAIEQVFTAHNAATALKLGQARGVAVAACAAYGISVSDYPPTLVKKTLVGTGYKDVGLQVFGPFEAPVYKLNEKFRMRLVIKSRNGQRFRALFREVLSQFGAAMPKNVTASIDINPSTV